MIDHVGLNVSDYEASKKFYEKALEPLGYRIVMDFPGEAAGFGDRGQPVFWIVSRHATQGAHVAFRAQQRVTVDAFHQAAIAAGGTDNGAPGVRAQYHEHYYGAFVLDPDGNNIEAVCHTPE